MISAFGVEHGEISKASSYSENRKKGNTARNVTLGALGVGTANGLTASYRSTKANAPLFNEYVSRSGSMHPMQSSELLGRMKLPKGSKVHTAIGLGALGAATGGLAANRTYRRRQRREANQKLG